MMGRKSGTGVRSAALVAIGALAGFGCEGTPEDDFYGPLVYDVLPAEVSGPFALEYAFADGESWQYADIDPGLGSFNTIPGKVYIMKGVDGQYPIIDALPGTLEYSPFWKVVEVEPPSGYEANQIKSLQTIEDAGLGMTETDRIMHCPVVNPDAAWLGTNLGVPIEALGFGALPIQVVWNAGLDMPNELYGFFELERPTIKFIIDTFIDPVSPGEDGVDPATLEPSDFFRVLRDPIFVPVTDPETGEPLLDPDTMEVVMEMAWPGFEFPSAFVEYFETRAGGEPFLTDADAHALDISLQPVWHKRLRGFCLPDVGDNSYDAEPDEFGDLQLTSLGALFEQWSPAMPAVEADPDADPPVEAMPPVESAPYGLTRVFGAAPGAAGYSPFVLLQSIVTTTGEQVTDAADFDADAETAPIIDPATGGPIFLHAPLVRQIPAATVAGGM